MAKITMMRFQFATAEVSYTIQALMVNKFKPEKLRDALYKRVYNCRGIKGLKMTLRRNCTHTFRITFVLGKSMGLEDATKHIEKHLNIIDNGVSGAMLQKDLLDMVES